MKQPSCSNPRIILGSILVALIIIAGFWIMKQTIAYTGPTGVPGESTTGAFRYNVVNNAVSVGGSVPDPATTLRVTGASNLNSAYGLVVENSNGVPALQVRDDGKVFVGGLVSADSATLQSQSIFSNFANYDTLTTNQGNVYNFIDGQGTANILDFSTIQGTTLNVNIGADYITSDIFGSQSVPGNYAFPAKLSVNSTTIVDADFKAELGVEGDVYVKNFLGIGKDPAVSLDIAGDGTASGRINFRYAIAPLEETYGQLYSDTNGVVLSSRNAAANYGLHFNVATTDTEVEQVRITTAGVGIGVFPPTAKLDVAGTIKTTAFQLVTGAQNGYVLQSDASGNASWQSVSALPAGSSGQTVRHDGVGWAASSLLYNNGTSVGVGTTIIDSATLLKVGETGYLQFGKTSAGAPGATDCNVSSHTGRITLDITNNFLYICTGSQWRGVKLTN